MNASEKIMKVGIAGYGVVGKRRREFIDRHPALRTIAVCDRTFGGSGKLPDAPHSRPSTAPA